MLSERSFEIQRGLLILFSAFLLLSIGFAVFLENPLILAGPVAAGLLFAAIADFRILFYLLIFSIPFSIHLQFGSLALDVPTEPLMISLLLISPFIFVIHHRQFNFIKHPIILIIAAQFAWAMYSTLFSVDHLVSVKYLIAKLWFIVPFIFIGGLILRKAEDFRRIFWLFFLPMITVCIYTSIRHYQQGFSFESANNVMQPFFHNHVQYSTTLALFLPFVWFARLWYRKWSYTRIFLNISVLLILFSIAFTYTRASWLATMLLVPSYFIIKRKWMAAGILAGLIGLSGGLYYVMHENKYLDFAIEYKKVIFHKGDIEKHLEATYQFEDVSGMERVYRWMAAKNMIQDKMLTGTGPNTFHPEYKKYTITLFETYLSENLERSTTHNYFLMLFSEQGIMGFFLFALLYIYLLLKGASLSNGFSNSLTGNLSIAATLSLISLLLHLAFNDLIETDKAGSLFFLSCMLILKLDNWKKQENDQEITQER